MIKDFKLGVLTIVCSYCGSKILKTIDNSFELAFNQEYQQYEPLNITCPTCEEAGVSTTIALNPNIPIGEYEEFEHEVIGNIPNEDINSRKFLRDIMWKCRPDLKIQDRVLYNSNGGEIVTRMLDKYRGTDAIKRGAYADVDI